MGRILEYYPSTGDCLYYDATGETENHDTALMVIMWYTFGRALDLTYIPMSSLPLSSDSPVTTLHNLALSPISIASNSPLNMSQTPLTGVLLRCEGDDGNNNSY
ncbi:hypothetical protein PHMEG_00012159 [Phytophthora megakarya]|uniref:Uncharacterized protein n=1 Tax=Phytophthora megakarya TaxID=4795 RepID=A0A225W9W3_9STRA|nr:hypothetical protein PHMEG_00012159 [Phytophthora megakarya]